MKVFDAILIVQLASTFIALVSGIIGVFSESKKSVINKVSKKTITKLTGWGWVSIIGLAIGTFFSGSAHYLKSEKEYNQKIIDDSIRAVQTKQQSENLTKLENIINNTSTNLNLSDSILVNTNIQNDRLFKLNSSSQKLNDNLIKTYSRQMDLLNRQSSLQYQQTRYFYKITPLTIRFVIDYSMSMVLIENYAFRLSKDIEESIRKKRNPIDMDMINFDIRRYAPFDLNKNPSWLPRKDDSDEGSAYDFLFKNDITFKLITAGGNEIKYPSGINDYGFEIDSLKKKIKINIKADFYNNKFIKEIVYENPPNVGTDYLSFSALDLINSKLEWDSMHLTYIGCNLSSISFEFPFYNGNSGIVVPIDIPRNSTFVIITAKDVGLLPVINTLNK